MRLHTRMHTKTYLHIDTRTSFCYIRSIADTHCFCPIKKKPTIQQKIRSEQAALEHYLIPDLSSHSLGSGANMKLMYWKKRALEGADGCGRMASRLYRVNADAHGLNSESKSN